MNSLEPPPDGPERPPAYSLRTADGGRGSAAEPPPGGEAAAFYATLEPGERAALLDADARIDVAEGADATATFEKGEALAAARDAVTTGTFTGWCEVRWAYHRTYAYSFMRVAERLGEHRARLIEARVDRSTLMALASRPERTVDLLAAFEGGRRPTFAEAQALISGRHGENGAGESSRPEDAGGMEGCASSMPPSVGISGTWLTAWSASSKP